MTEVHGITKEGGRIRAASLRATLDSLPDGPYRITIEDDVSKRSTGQNDYIHTVLRIYAKELNGMAAHGKGLPFRWTMEDVKEWSLSMFAPFRDIVTPDGEIIAIRKRTHEMSKEELGTFADTLSEYMWDTFRIITAERNEQLTIDR